MDFNSAFFQKRPRGVIIYSLPKHGVSAKCCMSPAFHMSLATTVHSKVGRVMTVSVQNAEFSKKKVPEM